MFHNAKLIRVDSMGTDGGGGLCLPPGWNAMLLWQCFFGNVEIFLVRAVGPLEYEPLMTDCGTISI